jgi:hypothetical protein
VSETPDILLLDDGELDELARALEGLDLAYQRLRGGEIGDAVRPPRRLLVATPRRASAVESVAGPGTPVAIVAAREDSPSMRDILRRRGFELLVRLPAHRAVWRLLVQRSLFRGPERRAEARLPVGSGVALETPETRRGALLVDVSNRGCRVLTTQELWSGSSVSVEIPASAAGGRPLRLEGRVLRVNAGRAEDGRVSHSAALLFDAEMSEATREHLASLLNSWNRGPASLAAGRLAVAPLPAVSSESLGITLDDETDPPVSANIEIGIEVGRDERRRHPRRAFEEVVAARSPGDSRVLMGRDLSAGGMRVERLPDLGVGEHLELAIWPPGGAEPLRVRARVVRDDGELGFALAFEDVPGEAAEALEKMVAGLPDVESLAEGEPERLGSVISEIL